MRYPLKSENSIYEWDLNLPPRSDDADDNVGGFDRESLVGESNGIIRPKVRGARN